MASIRDEILKLTNPEPILKDPENDFGLDSTANLIDKDDIGGSDISPEFSKLRRQAAGLLSDTDRKYAGKKLSRKDWIADSDSETDNEEDDDESDDVIDDDIDDDEGADNLEDDDKDFSGSGEDTDSQNDVDDDIEGFKSKINGTIAGAEFTFSDDGDYGKYGNDFDESEAETGSDSDVVDDDDDDDDDSGDDDENDAYDVDDDEEITSEDEEEDIQKFSAAAEDEIGKGNAAAQQLALWDTLLEGRIKLQKAASLINRLPQDSDWTHFSQENENFETEAKRTEKVLKHLLGSLTHLQNVLLAQNSETADLVDGAKKARSTPSKPLVPDDEEITSDSDEETMNVETKNTPVTVEKRKIKMEEYPGLLKKRYESFSNYRDTTIQKWYDKTRLAAGKVKGKSFSAFDQSAVVQIKQILADKDRLIRRTQIKRSAYRVLGKEPKMEDPEIIPSENGEPEVIDKYDDKNDDKYDEEIFDDDDFYHQLLRELIQRKTADINDPIASTRQWLQIQKLRRKKKRRADPKANKDRKIKYTVHKKLVNFMTPIDDSEWSHEARDDLFKSLFGRTQQLTDPAR